MRVTFKYYGLMILSMLVAMFFFFSFFSIPTVQVAKIVDVTNEEIIIMQNIIDIQSKKIVKLEQIQPPDYTLAILGFAWIMLIIVAIYSYQYFENKKELKKMELEAMSQSGHFDNGDKKK